MKSEEGAMRLFELLTQQFLETQKQWQKYIYHFLHNFYTILYIQQFKLLFFNNTMV